MKKLFFICSLITIHCSLFSQNWLWGRASPAYGDGWAAATDSSGNVFLTGAFSGTIFFGTDTLKSLYEDMYFAKYDNNGNVVWAVQSKANPGFSSAGGVTVATDSLSNSYVAGYFVGTVAFGTDTLHSINGYLGDAMILKYDANGNIQWARQSNASTNSYACGYSVSSDALGNVYFLGVFNGTIMFDTVKLNSLSVYNDIFIVKYDKNGNFIWAKQSHTSGTDDVMGLFVNINNMDGVYVSGWFTGAATFDSVALNCPSNSSAAMLLKYDTSGNLLWAKQSISKHYYGYAAGYTVTIDNSGNVYTSGGFRDTVTFGSFSVMDDTSVGMDIYIAKYSPAGKVIWVKQSHHTQKNDIWQGYSLETDKWNNIYFSAGASSYASGYQNFSVSFDSDTLNVNQAIDPATVMVLDTTGNVLCSTIIRTGGDDYNRLVCDPSGRYVYLGGDITDSITFNNDFLNVNGETPFIARWQDCCLGLNPVISGNASICSGDSVTLMASGGVSYLWSTGATTSTISVSPTSTTTYSVTVSTNGCADTATGKITVYPPPSGAACCNAIITAGQDTILSASGGVTYKWYSTNGLSCDSCASPIVNPTATTWYYVTITDSNGCSKKDSVLITVKEKPCGQLFVPDAFSPNNDGQNDILYVRGDCINTMDFIVFDRWGNKVFESKNKSDGWDGTYKGKPMNTGTYVWYLKATLNDGSTVVKKGNVALIR